MSKKELFVCGCSFSAEYIGEQNAISKYKTIKQPLDISTGYMKWNDQKPFKLWSAHVADELNLTLVNKSTSGSGNDRIYAKTLDYIIKNHKKIDKVIIQWSGIHRVDFEKDQERPWIGNNPGYGMKDWYSVNFAIPPVCVYGNKRGFENVITAFKNYNYPNITSSVNGFFRKVYSIQSILKELDIDYYFITGITDHVWPGDEIYDMKVLKHVIESDYFDLIDESRYIGWPIWTHIGGFSMQDIIHSDSHNNWKYWLNENDGHPNKLGHKKIAETILSAIKEGTGGFWDSVLGLYVQR